MPLILIIQDNGVALGTESDDRLRQALKATAAAHAITGLECDGNHVLDVHHAIGEARRLCLAGDGPVVVYARTFRMAGHATHDEREARQLFKPEIFAEWGRRDPIGCFEQFLFEEETILGSNPESIVSGWEEEVTAEIDRAEKEALDSRKNAPLAPEDMLGDVYASR